MSVYDIVFSPTGGTQKVSDLFTESFCAESTHIDLSDREQDFAGFSFQKEDIWSEIQCMMLLFSTAVKKM